MMNRTARLLLTALLAFGLAGCGRPAPSVPAAAAPESGPPAADVSAEDPEQPTVPARPAHTDLKLYLEGQEVPLPASLVQGEGYSLYLPDGEWRQTASVAAAEPAEADVFTARANKHVTLGIRADRSGLTLEQTREALAAAGYQQDEGSGIFSRHAEETVYCQKLTAQGGAVWHVSWCYPEGPEYAEGWGSRLPQVAATFRAEG